MDKSVLLLQASQLEPYSNLAVESYLLENLAPYEHALYLWQNDNTVVVGVNQNTFVEVSPSFKGYVARRLSGGGAVYHDAGNLNFTFVSAKRSYSVENNKKIILDAIKSLGFNAEFTGRNDIVIDSKKISGQAYCLRQKASYHHGTILINSNVEKIEAALVPSSNKLKSKGVASVSARVGNLIDWNSNITLSDVREALENSFKKFYSTYRVDTKTVDYNNEKIKEYSLTLSNKEWIWGKNPQLKNKITKRFECGEVTIYYQTKGDKAIEVEVFSDAMDTEMPKQIRERLLNTPVHEWNL